MNTSRSWTRGKSGAAKRTSERTASNLPRVSSVDVGGTQLYYELDGEGTSLLLIHPSMLDSRIWEDQIQPLSRYYQVIHYDRRGHGKTPYGNSKDKLYSETSDIHALLQFLHVDHMYVLGAGNGAEAALDFALEYPQMVGGIVLISPTVTHFTREQAEAGTQEYIHRQQTQEEGPAREEFAQNLEENLQSTSTFISAMLEGDISGAVDAMMDKLPFDPEKDKATTRQRLREIIAQHLQNMMNQSNPEAPIHSEPPVFFRLSEIHIPVLIIEGGRDNPTTHREANELADKIPNGRKATISDAQSMTANIDHPEEFNKITLDFLQELQGK